jgi:hypothetical protein
VVAATDCVSWGWGWWQASDLAAAMDRNGLRGTVNLAEWLRAVQQAWAGDGGGGGASSHAIPAPAALDAAMGRAVPECARPISSLTRRWVPHACAAGAGADHGIDHNIGLPEISLRFHIFTVPLSPSTRTGGRVAGWGLQAQRQHVIAQRALARAAELAEGGRDSGSWTGEAVPEPALDAEAAGAWRLAP